MLTTYITSSTSCCASCAEWCDFHVVEEFRQVENEKAVMVASRHILKIVLKLAGVHNEFFSFNNFVLKIFQLKTLQEFLRLPHNICKPLVRAFISIKLLSFTLMVDHKSLTYSYC